MRVHRMVHLRLRRRLRATLTVVPPLRCSTVGAKAGQVRRECSEARCGQTPAIWTHPSEQP